jgi:hypothetical protein
MSTRSLIGMADAKGQVKCVYCHWDGYPSWNGRLLLEHWSDRKKLAELLALGDISVLSREIGQKIDFNRTISDTAYREEHAEQCVIYHRDRGEKWTIVRPRTVKSESAFVFRAFGMGCDYCYLLRADGRWVHARTAAMRKGDPLPSLEPLTAELCAAS